VSECGRVCVGLLQTEERQALVSLDYYFVTTRTKIVGISIARDAFYINLYSPN